MVRVEISPGQFVKCFANDEARVRDMFARTVRNRRGENGMAVLSSKSFVEMNQRTRAKKGPLVKVEIGPGQFVKMYREDAIAAGHLSPSPPPPSPQPSPSKEVADEYVRGEKGREAEGNKIKRPQEDKSKSGEGVSVETGAQAADDFTGIPGVGKATARLLRARGVETLEQLRTADVSFLSAAAQAAIQNWRGGRNG